MKQQQTKRKKEKGGRDPIYEDAFKLAVAREYLRGELGYVKLGRKYKISDSTVRLFVKWYKANYDIGPDLIVPPFVIEKGQIINTSPSCSENSEAALVRELEEANLKIAALQTMISLAKTELGIDILKNSGARQSKS